MLILKGTRCTKLYRILVLKSHKIHNFDDLIVACLCSTKLAVLLRVFPEMTCNKAFYVESWCHEMMCYCILVICLVFAVCMYDHPYFFVFRYCIGVIPHIIFLLV